MSGCSSFSAGVFAKYSDSMPVWAFLELTSFGTPIDFVRFCAGRWGDKALLASHYDLKGVKSIRNCAAHGSCIINLFSDRTAGKGSVTNSVARAVGVAGVSKATRAKWMSCAAMQHIATVLVSYASMVPPGRTRSRSEAALAGFFGRVGKNAALLPSNGPDSTAWAALSFLKSLTRGLGMLD